MEHQKDATNDEVLAYVRQLVRSVGVRRDVSERELAKAEHEFVNRKIARCVALVHGCFGNLPKLRIHYIADEPLLKGVSVKSSSKSEWEKIQEKFDGKIIIICLKGA